MIKTSVQTPQVLIRWCGRQISYADGLRIQKQHLNAHFDTNSSHPKNTLLLLEHSPVYTIGIRQKNYPIDEILRLRKLRADFYQSDRGGLITFHGPGQLVAYPILNLQDFQHLGCSIGARGIKWYVCQLEQCLVRLCSEFGFKAHAPGPPLTGVWINDEKVAAIGIHATQRTYVSHGLALNCDVDLTWFDHITPCGLEGKKATSLQRELLRTNSTKSAGVGDVIQPFVDAFVGQFQCDPVYD